MPPQTSRRIAWTACFILVFVSAFFLNGTQQPPLELDPSWHAAIEYATAHHLQFGTEIVFTFGPLGFLSARTSLGHLVGPRIAFAFFWSVIIAVAAIDVAKRLRGWVRYGFLAWLIVFTLSSGLDQTAFFVLACATILLIQDDPRERWQSSLFVLAFIFLSLIKFTFALAALGSIALVAVCWVLQGKIRKAIVLVLAAPAGFIACWAALGQSLYHIPPWFKHGLQLASGYSGAMNLVPKTSVLCVALVALALFVSALFTTLARARRNLLTWSISITSAQYVFLAWKEGFTRAGDWHIFVLLWFLPLGVCFLFTIKPLRVPTAARQGLLEAAFAAVMAACVLAANLQIPGFTWQQVTAWPRRMIENAGLILAAISGRGNELYATSRDAGTNPMLVLERAKDVIGHDSVDVMNYLLLAPMVNGMNYRPRPVIQGFVAYTPALQELNANYFHGADRPRYVLLAHQATDGRFPMLEDSAALNYVLNNYVPVARDGVFLVLQQRTTDEPRFHLVHEESLRFGENFDLRPWAHGPLFMSVEIVPTLVGRLADFLYQRQPLYMRIGRGGENERFRIVPSMAELPFLMSPLLKSNYDILNFLASQSGNESESVTFEPPERGSLEFSSQIRVRLYTAPEFPRAAREVPGSRILADVQGRIFWPEPESVESAGPGRVTISHGTPALMVCAPSIIELKIPVNASSFSGYFGIPEDAQALSENSEGLEVTISIEDQSGHSRLALHRILQPKLKIDDVGRFSFRIPIDSAYDRILTLKTSPRPSGTAEGDWSFWSDCRIDLKRSH